MKFIPSKRIERIAMEDFNQYLRKKGIERADFPLDPEDIFLELFGLTTNYIDFNEHNINLKSEGQLLGALYPKGFYFLGTDELILVNAGLHSSDDIEQFPHIEQMQRFTAFHEGGHAALHVRPSEQQTSFFEEKPQYYRDQPFLCRTDQVSGRNYSPLEFQANRYAAAMMMPAAEVYLIVKDHSPIDLQIIGPELRKHFDVSQMALEKRLSELEYQFINGKYPQFLKERRA